MSYPKVLLFVGSYTRRLSHVDGKAGGIHILEHDPASPHLLRVVECDIAMGDGPSFLAVSKGSAQVCGAAQKHTVNVFACNEGSPDDPGTVTSASLELLCDADGVRLSSTQDTRRHVADVGSSGPCHVHLSPSRRSLAVATYHGGCVSLHSVGAGAGPVVSAPEFKQHHEGGSMVVADRQEKGHAHQCLFLKTAAVGASSASVDVIVTDLGSDTIWAYTWDESTRSAQARDCVALPPGCGPRHAVQHPHNSSLIFILTELSNEVLTLRYNATRRHKMLELLPSAQSVVAPSTRPETAGAGAVAVSFDGALLFASVRGTGHDYVCVLSINHSGDDSVALHPLAFIHDVGACPRDLAAHPALPFLYVAAQNGERVSVYRWTHRGNDFTAEVCSQARCATPASVLPVLLVEDDHKQD